MLSIFISYSRKDASEIAEILSNRLRALKYDVFRDKDNLVGSQKWKDELINNIFQCDLMIVLVTELSNDSDYVYEEINIAKTYDKPILPVRVNNTKLPVYLRQIQAIEFTNNNYGDVLLEIKRALDAIPDHQLTEKAPTSEPKVKKLPNSSRGIILLILLIGIIGIAYLVLNQYQNNSPNIAQQISPTPTMTLTLTLTRTATPTPISPTPTVTETLAPPTSTWTPIPPTPTQIFGQVLLAEDFERAIIPSDWKQKSGQWIIVTDGSNAALQPIGDSTIELGNEQWSNYKLETDIRVTNLSIAKKAWVDVHTVSSADKMIILAFDFQSNYLILMSKNGGEIKELEKIKFQFPEDKWLKLRIDAVEPLLTVYINDTPLIVKLVANIFRRGAIRLTALNSYVLFDNIRVSSLEN